MCVEDAGECKEGVLEVARRVGSRAIGADEGREGLSWVGWWGGVASDDSG
jgi:hypothetical protein